MEETNIQGFGYTEMYEWSSIIENNIDRIGRFVTFDKEQPSKIRLAHDNDDIIGITTVCAKDTSDDPNEWKYSYMCNEYGDLYLRKERLAVGTKQYDQYLEMNYIRTYPWEHYVKILNNHIDPNAKYVKRSNRPEWIRVNLLGKVIVKDNGKCKPGEYCVTYSGKIKDLWGTAIPASDTDTKQKFYVLERLSDNTILILNK